MATSFPKTFAIRKQQMTDINEAKAAKAALQERIQLALREFTNKTGFTVERVELTRNYMLSETPDYVVDVEVRL